MKNHAMLTGASLLSIVLFACHLAHDVVYGIEPGGVNMYTGVVICFVWLYGTLVLGERRAGHVVMLLGSILAAGVSYLHMTGVGLVDGKLANADGQFFWVLTLLALGVIGLFSLVLSARGLWSLFRGPSARITESTV